MEKRDIEILDKHTQTFGRDLEQKELVSILLQRGVLHDAYEVFI
jgi:hypothetical protein